MRKNAKGEHTADDNASGSRNAENHHQLLVGLANQDDPDLSFEVFVKAHGLAPLNDIKTACRVANVGLTRFYELVAAGDFILVPNGGRRNVTAANLYKHYRKLIASARSDRAA